MSHTSQIIQNLVHNAIKFSAGSAVSVTVLMEPAQPQATDAAVMVLRVDVSDGGAGLTAEECERIFKPFERAAPEKARRSVHTRGSGCAAALLTPLRLPRRAAAQGWAWRSAALLRAPWEAMSPSSALPASAPRASRCPFASADMRC